MSAHKSPVFPTDARLVPVSPPPSFATTLQANIYPDDASAAAKCVCSANNVSNLIPLCSSCIGKFQSDKSKDDDSAVSSFLSQCSLKTTAYNAAAISAVATSTDTTTKTDVVSKTSVAVIITSTSTKSNPAATKTAGAAIGIGALGFALGML